jgi:hypothetical protein
VELIRVARGDRVLTVFARESRAYETALTAKGRLPGVQQAGVRRRLRIDVRGGAGERPPGPIAEWVDEVVMESESSPEELAAMIVDGATVEVCEDPTPTDRVAFRVRSATGAPLRSMDDRFRGAFFLDHFVVPMRYSIAAADCGEALAAMPLNADAFIATELAGVTEEHRVVRTGLVTPEGRVQHTELPGSASLTAIAAALESRAVVPLLAWAARDPPALTPQVAAFIRDHESDPAHARALVEMLSPSCAVGVEDVGTALELIDSADLDTLASEVSGVAHEVATTCARPGTESRCTPTRLIAVAHTAARTRSRVACDELTALAAALLGSPRARSHSPETLTAFDRELEGCDGVEPAPDSEGDAVFPIPEDEAPERRLGRHAARVRALPVRPELALRDAVFDLCEEAGRLAADCAPARGTLGACHFLLQRIDERDALTAEIRDGRRALARMPHARRDDEYPHLVGGYEHELVQLDAELSALVTEVRDGAAAIRAASCAPAVADAFEVAAHRLYGIVGAGG